VLARLGHGAKQTKEDETPTSPKSPRVAPVDHASGDDETPVPALLDKKDFSRDDEELSPKSDGSAKSRHDDTEAASPLDEEPGRAASQRSSLLRRLSSIEALEIELAATRKELTATQQEIVALLRSLVANTGTS